MPGTYLIYLITNAVFTPDWAGLSDPPAPSWRAQEHFLSDFDMLAIGVVLLAVLVLRGVKKIMERQDEAG